MQVNQTMEICSYIAWDILAKLLFGTQSKGIYELRLGTVLECSST